MTSFPLRSGLVAITIAIASAAISCSSGKTEPRATTRADLYALAVLAFECLTGRVPFVGDCLTAMRAQHLEPKRPSLSAFRPDLAGPIDDWMDRALHPDPFWRFPTADAMKRSLAVALRGTEIALEQTRRAA